MTIPYAISVGIADVRCDPSPSSELVTQALMNVRATADTITDEWTHVTLPDYTGWVRTNELADPIERGFCKVGEGCATPLDLVAVVTVPHTSLYTNATKDEIMGKIYLSTVLPLLDTTHHTRLQVALPNKHTGWIARETASIRRSSEIYPSASIDVVTTYAQSFLGRPYLWGGTSWEGIDCSGFVQLCYRMGGNILPRNADQQHDALSYNVEREKMQKGDLIFFGRNAITHVGLALNHQEYIHAEGQNHHHILTNSFDPTSPRYDQRLCEIVRAIKRVRP